MIYKVLSTSAYVYAVLVIFGPKQIVEEDANGRYRSLVRVLPSLLMKRMGAHLEATKPVSQDSTGFLNVGVGADANIVFTKNSESWLQRTMRSIKRSCCVYLPDLASIMWLLSTMVKRQLIGRLLNHSMWC
jgi:hypothetical protein